LIGFGHGSKASVGVKTIGIVEDGLGFGAEGLGDGISCDSRNGGLRVGDNNTILNVEALDFIEVAAGGSGIGQELSYDCEDLCCVDDHAWAVECLVSHSVGVEITSIGIGSSSIARCGVSTSTGIASTSSLGDIVGGMRGKGSRDGVCFPDIHLSTA
jgi:hypothetical protein